MEEISPVATDILQKRLEELTIEKNKIEEGISKAQTLTESLPNLADHPRYAAMIPLTDLCYTQATLNTTEFMVKLGDHNTITSLNQTINYINKAIRDLQSQHDLYEKEIEQLQIRLNLMAEFKAMNVKEVSENSFIAQRGDLIEIMEFEDVSCERSRKPRFKTTAERDEFLKQHQKK